MSNDNPYGGGPYPGPQGPPSGPQGQPTGPQPQPSAPGGYGYPPPPPPQNGPTGSGYAFGPFAPGAGGPGAGGPSGPGGPYGPPPGQQPPYPGGPPPKKSRTKLALIAGAVAVVLIAGTTGIIVANGNDTDINVQPPPTTATSQPASTDPTPVNGPSSTVPSPAPPVGGTASDAVTGYLQALAKGDANAAIGYSAEPVDKGGTLSTKVLRRSNKLAPLTEITVSPVTDPAATSVDATYRLGNKAVKESFDVTKVGDDWKLARVVADLNLSRVRVSGLKVKLNGATVTSSTVSVFPGRYQLTTGSKQFSITGSTVSVRSPNDLVSTSKVKLAVTSAGKSAAKRAVTRNYRSCLGERALAPKNCPFRISAGSFKINKSSIRWTQVGSNPLRNTKITRSGIYLRVPAKINVEFNASCTVRGRASTCSGDVKGTTYAYVNGIKPSRQVRWALR